MNSNTFECNLFKPTADEPVSEKQTLPGKETAKSTWDY
jgi:hypothetical protein